MLRVRVNAGVIVSVSVGVSVGVNTRDSVASMSRIVFWWECQC